MNYEILQVLSKVILIVIIVFLGLFLLLRYEMKKSDVSREIINRYQKLIDETFDVDTLIRIYNDLRSETVVTLRKGRSIIKISNPAAVNNLFHILNIKIETIQKIKDNE
jgi:regulatory protein YycI of two-component signal transduction system YycFG